MGRCNPRKHGSGLSRHPHKQARGSGQPGRNTADQVSREVTQQQITSAPGVRVFFFFSYQAGNLLVAVEGTDVPGRQLQDGGESLTQPLTTGLQLLSGEIIPVGYKLGLCRGHTSSRLAEQLLRRHFLWFTIPGEKDELLPQLFVV